MKRLLPPVLVELLPPPNIPPLTDEEIRNRVQACDAMQMLAGLAERQAGFHRKRHPELAADLDRIVSRLLEMSWEILGRRK